MLHLIDLQQIKKLCKVSLALVLCAVLILVPIIDRVHSVAAVDDVAVLILLTILLSMGISLVLGSSETPDQFFSSKFPLFKQQHDTTIIEQTIGAWLLADIQQTAISLKDGILSLPKTVVSKAKEFIAWLIPNPASDSVVDFNTGSVDQIGILTISKGSFNSSGTFVITNLETKITIPYLIDIGGSYSSTDTSGSTLSFSLGVEANPRALYADVTNGFDARDLITRVDASDTAYISTGGMQNGYTLCLQESSFVINNVTCLPGVYLAYINHNYNPLQSYRIVSFHNNPSIPICVAPLSSIPAPDLADQAVIGDYNDISGIKDISKEISGTTIIENQFQISSAGQALNSSGETLDDLINALRDAIENLNQRAEVTAVTDAVAEAGTVQPDYGDFDLGKINLSGLGALLTTRFPFSIPWDLGRIFGLFVADPEPPRWEFDMIPIEALSGVDTTITLDLGEYPIVGQISRWFCIIDLCIGLCYVTKRLIWVA